MPIQFSLPTRFEDKLKSNRQLEGAVKLTLSNFEPWIADNKTVFFHEYTDHGIDHISNVLLTADGLMTDAAWNILTSEDIAVLTLGIVLHDSAMHLSEDGFITAVSSYKCNGLMVDDIRNDLDWFSVIKCFSGSPVHFLGDSVELPLAVAA